MGGSGIPGVWRNPGMRNGGRLVPVVNLCHDYSGNDRHGVFRNAWAPRTLITAPTCEPEGQPLSVLLSERPRSWESLATESSPFREDYPIRKIPLDHGNRLARQRLLSLRGRDTQSGTDNTLCRGNLRERCVSAIGNNQRILGTVWPCPEQLFIVCPLSLHVGVPDGNLGLLEAKRRDGVSSARDIDSESHLQVSPSQSRSGTPVPDDPATEPFQRMLPSGADTADTMFRRGIARRQTAAGGPGNPRSTSRNTAPKGEGIRPRITRVFPRRSIPYRQVAMPNATAVECPAERSYPRSGGILPLPVAKFRRSGSTGRVRSPCTQPVLQSRSQPLQERPASDGTLCPPACSRKAPQSK